jgi:vitamin B12 transporter
MLCRLVVLSFVLSSVLLLNSVLIEASQIEDPIVVTGSRIEKSVQRIGKSVSVVTSDQIEESGATSLVEALRNTPGVRMQQLGSPGKLATIRIRGTRSFDTALLVNGMPLRDPSDPRGSVTPFIEDLLLDDIQQVEVIRGSASTLYGSDALGGAVNIILKKGTKEGVHVRSLFDGGTHHSYRHSHQVSGVSKSSDYFLGYTRYTNEGFRGDDAFNISTYMTNFGYTPDPKLEIRYMTNAYHSKTDLNDGPTFKNGTFVEDINDPNDFSKTRLFHYNALIKYRPHERFENIIRLGFSDSDRRSVARVDESDTSFRDDQFDGNAQNFEYQSNITINNRYSISLGAEYEREWMSQTVNNTEDEFNQFRYAGYLENQLSFLEEKLNIAIGGRIGYHETSHTLQSGEASASYLIGNTGTRLKSHFGTGFREPSLYELFGRSSSDFGTFTFGNKTLKPEKSISWDMGIEQNLFGNSLKLVAAYFRNDLQKKIDFIGASYNNVEGGNTHGFELEALWHPVDSLKIGLTHTRTDGRADATSLVDIPRNLSGATFDWKMLDTVYFHADLTFKGDEQFQVFEPAPTFTSHLVHGDEYFKLDAKLSYQMTGDLQAWVRAENILNDDIIERGFRGPGATFYGGVKVEF